MDQTVTFILIVILFKLLVVTAESSTGSTSVKELLKLNTNPDAEGFNSHKDLTWMHQPKSVNTHLTQHNAQAYRRSSQLTRIAKSLSHGLEPYFDKGLFEPFERRPKLTTLVAIRKNGITQRIKPLNVPNHQLETGQAEIAELQSPYYDVSNFWREDSSEFKN